MSIQVGQTIYIVGTDHRRGADNSPVPAVVTKIGRKYFETDKVFMGRFNIETLLHDAGQYHARYRAYLSLQQIEDEKEYARLLNHISETFRWAWGKKFTLDQLRKITAIINQP